MGASLLEFHRPPPGLIDQAALQTDPLFEALRLDSNTRTVLAFLRQDPLGYARTLLPLGATVWITTSLLDRSLRYATTGELDRLSRTLETTAKQFYQRERDALKQDALAGRALPTMYSSANEPQWPESVRAFWESGEPERFGVSGASGERVDYMRRVEGDGGRSCVTSPAPSSWATARVTSRLTGRSAFGAVNEMSAWTPTDTFCTIMSTLIDRSASALNSRAAMPGRSGTPVIVTLASEVSWVTAEMIACSMLVSSLLGALLLVSLPASVIHVPGSHVKLDRTWRGT